MKKVLLLIAATTILFSCDKESFEEKEKSKVDQKTVFNLVAGDWKGENIETGLEMKILFRRFPNSFYMERRTSNGRLQYDFDTDDFFFTKYYDFKTKKEVPDMYIINAPSNVVYGSNNVPQQTSLIFKIDKDTMYVNSTVGASFFSEKDMYILQRVKD